MRAKPDEIPQDVCDAASRVYETMYHTDEPDHLIIARAIMAERERSDAIIESARQFVKRHPALTLLDLAEFEAFVGLFDAMQKQAP